MVHGQHVRKHRKAVQPGNMEEQLQYAMKMLDMKTSKGRPQIDRQELFARLAIAYEAAGGTVARATNPRKKRSIVHLSAS